MFICCINVATFIQQLFTPHSSLSTLTPSHHHFDLPYSPLNMPKQIAYSAFKLHTDYTLRNTHTHTTRKYIYSAHCLLPICNCICICVYLCTTYGIFKIFFVRNFFRFVSDFFLVLSVCLSVCVVCVSVYTWIIFTSWNWSSFRLTKCAGRYKIYLVYIYICVYLYVRWLLLGHAVSRICFIFKGT